MTDLDPRRMTESERADYYYEHRDDPEVWNEAQHGRPRRLSTVLSIRFGAAEAERVNAAAENAGMTLSAYVRQSVLSAAGEPVVDQAKVRKLTQDLKRRADTLDSIVRGSE
jgi:uncharacterized protein (DUF1778 family)